MKKTTKVLVFDIDGTIFDHSTYTVADHVNEAIQLAKQAGLKVILATGRNYWGIGHVIRDTIGPDGYVTVNGLAVYEQNRLIQENMVPPDHVKILVELCLDNAWSFAFQTRAGFVAFDARMKEDILRIQNHQEGVILQPFEWSVLDIYDIYHVVIHVGQFDLLDKALKDLPHLRVDVFKNNYVDVYLQAHNKATGIQVLLDLWHLSWDEVAAFGDSSNDVDMLQHAHYPYVVQGGLLDKQNLPYRHVAGPASKQLSDTILKHLPTAFLANLSSQQLNRRMGSSVLKTFSLLSASFALIAFNYTFIRKDVPKGYYFWLIFALVFSMTVYTYWKEKR